MSKSLKKQSNVAVTFTNGEQLQQVSVTIYPGWVEVEQSGETRWYPRERIESIRKRGGANR
ncbi:hypothetical protein ACFR9U_18080 [Halorientalis brevis]|uniref:Uncharacterized protein n=1 Tax=Halorientalis brevis TaxID=1126241 RepID=A0ABD6CFB6_9EURY|nr:hypothetical protein [Halorientalis brevis]